MKYRLLLVLALGSVGACSSFDATRTPAPQGTLGEEIVRVFCERMYSEAERARPEGEPRDVSGVRFRAVCRGEEAPALDAPARVVALMANRDRLVAALDATLPEDLTDELGGFLGELLPLMDDPVERVPRSTRLLSDFLAALSSDDAALDAMSRMGRRTGYRPLRLGLGVIRPALAYPELDDFVGLALRTLTDLPDDATDGLAVAEWQAVQAALALELATLAPADPLPAGERSTLDLTRELMFTSDTRFGGSTAPRWVLRRDERGMALPAGGVVAAPFVDGDGDGLADVDSRGRFVDAALAPLTVPSPFATLGEVGVARDASGRAISTGAMPVYAYLDGDDTFVAGLVREALPWFDEADPTLLRLSRGLPFLLGTPGTRTETYGMLTHSYEGWDPARSSLVDLVYGASELMHRDRFDDVLTMLETLIRDHESAAAGVVESGHVMLTASDRFPLARMRAGNSFWDDMIELAIRLDRRPGMLEAVLRSFADRRSESLGSVYAGLMRHRDRITYDPANPNGSPLGFPIDDPVDRSRPDVDGNESLFERTLALIDGLDGVRVCNRAGARLDIDLGIINLRYPLIGTADECELIDIPNVAEAYALAILGTYELEIQDGFLNAMLDVARVLGINVDDVLERSSGIDGLTTHPSPQALNRLVFWALDDDGSGRCTPGASPHHCNSDFAANVFARVRDRHGNDVVDTYHGTIFSWEQPGFYEGMRPLVEVLEDPRYRLDAEGNYAFGNIITTIWEHWPTADHWVRQSTDPAAPNYVPGDDARSYEDLIATGFGDGPSDGRLIRNLVEASVTLDGLDMGGGQDGIDILAAAAHDMLNPDASPGLRTRDGRATVPRNDGGGTMAVTPMLLILDALRNIDRDLAAIPDAEEAERIADWRAARDSLAEQFLDTRPVGAAYAFTNQRARAIVLAVLPFLRGRLDAHRAAGDLVTWSRELPTDLSDLLGSPLVGGLVRFLDRVNADPEARDALLRLVSYLVDEASENDAFLSIVYAVADLLQVMDDDLNLVPLARAISPMLAPNARDVVATGAGTLDLRGSMTFDALGLLREIHAIDSGSTLPAILRNLVALQPDESTPLETILDVISEVNRVAPGAGGAYEPDDYRTMFGEMTGAMDDTRHGMERLYDVVQERELR